MSNDLQKKHDRLVEKVRKMRHHQKRYFQYKTGVDLEKSKYYEREVDKALADEPVPAAAPTVVQQQLLP